MNDTDMDIKSPLPLSSHCAHERAPIEIWERILRIAIESPLFPYLNDGIVDLCLLFTHRCRSQRIQREIEHTRTQLRLVCTSWDLFLRERGVRFNINGLGSKSPQRVEAFSSILCGCRPPCVGARKTRPISNADQQEVSLQEESIKIYIFAANHPIDMLEAATNLEALYIVDTSHRTIDHFFQLDCVQNLTHLNLCRAEEYILKYAVGPVHFPRLRCLVLSFLAIASMTHPVNGAALAKWGLPMLCTLKLEGSIHPRLEPEITQFLDIRRVNVTNFYIDLKIKKDSSRRVAYVLPPSIWISFPNLNAFGISSAMYARQPPAPPPIHPKISLLVDPRRSRLLNSDNRLKSALRNLLGLLHKWRLVEVILLVGWDQMLYWKSNHDVEEVMFSDEFFLVARKEHLRVLDVHRKVISDEIFGHLTDNPGAR